MANDVNVDPRYLRYNKDDVERILGSVEAFDSVPIKNSNKPVKSGGIAKAIEDAVDNIPMASEEGVRNIVKDWTSETETEE